MHDQIRNTVSYDKDDPDRVYDPDLAIDIFNSHIRKYSHRRLSIMKQENIREAAEKELASLGVLKFIIVRLCGYCFKYGYAIKCETCPLYKKILTRCGELHSFIQMKDARTFKAFLAAHRQWCNELGFKEVYGGK